MKFTPKDIVTNVYFWIFLFMVLPLLTSIILFFVSGFTKTVTVNKVYDLRYRRSNGLLFEDSDGNNYRVSNVWFLGRFNSLEEWNKLKTGQKYQVKGYGYRVGFLGMYPNVYDIQVV